MTIKKLTKKYGAVILLDALGASSYSDREINNFLSLRKKLNSNIKETAKQFRGNSEFSQPIIYTFGDTTIIVIELNDRKVITNHIIGIAILMRRYLYQSFDVGIMFRGSFSIGNYIEDAESNTVMGEAVTDAASWYEQSNWMGLTSTPKTNNILDFYFLENEDRLDDKGLIHKYDVPLKNGYTFKLYSISWPGAFHEPGILKNHNRNNAKEWFLEKLAGLEIPKGTEEKYENTKLYFSYIENQLVKKIRHDHS